MRRVLIHIGYPKTGTTTLQEAVFAKLHSLGYINYLGRTLLSSHVKLREQRFSGRDYVKSLRESILKGKTDNLMPIELSSDKLNVFSDEELSMDPFFREVQYGISFGYTELLKTLKALFSKADEIHFLLTIREQSELITSCFLQKYRFLISKFPDFTLENYLFENNRIKEQIDKVYNFSNLLMAYDSESVKGLTILLFEDMRRHSETYWKALGEVLSVDPSLISKLGDGIHLRNRKNLKNPLGLLKKPTQISNVLAFVVGRNRYANWLERFFFMRNSLILDIFSKLLIKKVPFESPVISQQVTDEIKFFFRQRNLEFAQKFGCNFERMQTYGYFE